jgi:hypothetical protein
MHSLSHPAFVQAVAADRLRSAEGTRRRRRPERPPSVPARARAAYAAGRFARRLDPEMARRAVV